jgi:hypothetical protein
MKKLDVYGKTRRYVGQFARGEIDKEELYHQTNWNIVTKSHMISNDPGAEGHQHRQNLRKRMWSCTKKAFPDMFGGVNLPADIRGNSFAKKKRR